MKHHGKWAAVALAVALLAGPLASAADRELKNDDLRKELSELRDEIAAMRRMHAATSRATDLELRLLNERLDRLENAVARMSSGASTRRAGFFAPGAVPAVSAIRLDNRLAVPATVTIDGVAYSVPAFTVRMLPNRPAGMITYEVTALGFGVRAPVRTPLDANETLTLTIY
jgi:hypothetical protein